MFCTFSVFFSRSDGFELGVVKLELYSRGICGRWVCNCYPLNAAAAAAARCPTEVRTMVWARRGGAGRAGAISDKGSGEEVCTARKNHGVRLVNNLPGPNRTVGGTVFRVRPPYI